MEPKTTQDTQQSDRERGRQDQWVQDKESLLSFFNLQYPSEAKHVDNANDSDPNGVFVPPVDPQGQHIVSSTHPLTDFFNMVSGGNFWDELTVMDREVIY